MHRSRFHPELRLAAALIPQISFGPTLTKFVNWLQRSRTPQMQSFEAVKVRDEFITGTDQNSIRIRLYHPVNAQRPLPAILWIHGGGFTMGVPEQDQRHSVELCSRLGYVVAAVDYRLAAEKPFPAPLDDCYSALSWLYKHAAELRIDRGRIAVGGNSAGAGLAAALALVSRDRREIPIKFQLLIYPMLDDRTTRRRDIDDKKLRLWTMASNRYGWATYLGMEPGGDHISEYAAPARQTDLSGLPPAWIGVGTCDLFHDEDVEYARRMKEAGVPCELYVVEGAFHGFEVAGLDKNVVRKFRQSYFDALLSADVRT